MLSEQITGTLNNQSQPAINIDVSRMSDSQFGNNHAQSDHSMSYSPSPARLLAKPTVNNLQNYEMLTVVIKDIKIKKRDCIRQNVVARGKPNLILKQLGNHIVAPVQQYAGLSQPDLSSGYGMLSPGLVPKKRLRHDNRYGTSVRESMRQSQQQASLTLHGGVQASRAYLRKTLARSHVGRHVSVTRKNGGAQKQTSATRRIKPIAHELREQINRLQSRQSSQMQNQSQYNVEAKPYLKLDRNRELGSKKTIKTHSLDHQRMEMALEQLDETTVNFVARNKGIQKFLLNSMHEEQSLNFDIFKKSENVEKLNKTAMLSPKESRNSFARTQVMFNTMQESSKLPNLQPAARWSQPAAGMEEEKISMRQRFQSNDSSVLSQRKSVANDHQQRMNTSESTFKQDSALGKSNVLQQQRMRQYRKQMLQTMEEKTSSGHKNNKLKLHAINEKYRNDADSAQKSSRFFKTEQGFYKGINKNSSMLNSYDMLYMREESIQSRDAELKAINLVEKRFESLDTVGRAKMMRISSDETRQDRFMSLYDQKKSELQKRIRESAAVSARPISKSVMLERGQGGLMQLGLDLHTMAIKEEEDQDSIGEVHTGVSKLSLKSIRKIALYQASQNEELLHQTSKTKTDALLSHQSSKRAVAPMIEREHKISQALLDTNTFERINEPIIAPGIVRIWQPPIVQPYIPPKKVDVAQLALEEAEAQELRVRKLQAASRLIPKSSLLLKIPAQSPNADATKDGFKRSSMRPRFTLELRQQSASSIQSQELKASGFSSEFQEEASSWDNRSDSSNSIKAREVDLMSEDISEQARQSDLEAIDNKTNGYIRQLLANTKQDVVRINKKAKVKIMHGRSLYGFPTIETLEKHNEVSAQQDLETSMGRRFETNPAQLGLAMVDQEKRDEEHHAMQKVNSSLDLHAQFLTGDEKKELGDEFAIFRHNPLIKKPGAAYDFIELCDVELQMMADNANQFEKMILYQQINKVANCSKVQESRAEHPEYVYYVECAQDTDLPLPILSHIYGNTLNLSNYTLSSGHCQGLNSAAPFLQKKINRVRLDNCGIDDGEMASLLSAFNQFKDFKSIVYRRGEVHEDTLDGLVQLFQKKVPYHLQELRISNCRMTPDITTDLIQAIMEKSQLKQFELSETELFLDDVETIGEFLTKSRQLEELELKGNNMIPQLMDILLGFLRENKKLLQVNLSYNNMIDGFSGNNMQSVLATEATVKEKLFTFIRGNKKLIHIDLTATNLSEAAILHILPAIQKAKSLQGVHLSGNPGVTETVKQEARRLLRTHPDEARKNLNLVKFFTPETIEHYREQWLRESVKIKHITTGKSLVQNGATDDKFITFDSKMILMRYLTHKQEIPGSGQWQLLSRKQDLCWLCEREMKGYVFWSPGFSQKCKKIMRLSDGEKQAIFEEIEPIEAVLVQQPMRPMAFIPPPPEDSKWFKKPKPQEPPAPVYKKVPVICGSFTNWKPRKMMNLFDFIQQTDKPENKLDFSSMFDFLKKNFMFGQHSEIEKFEECQAYHLNVIDDMIKKREPKIFLDWRMNFEKTLAYKKPFFINSDAVRNMKNYRDIYVAPVFARSGRQTFVIQPGESHETIETYSSIIDFRQEDIPPKTYSASHQNVKVFQKTASVFTKWKQDNDKVREKCLHEHDFLLWKLEKFVKDDAQRGFIERAFNDNFQFVKGCFTEMAAETAWPHVTQLGLHSFCQRAGLIDNKYLKINDIDRMFAIARYEANSTEKHKNISRFMFMEALSRIGLQRFLNSGKDGVVSPAEALLKTFETIRQHWKYDNWEQWRWDYLYVQEVHDILNANLTGLRKLLGAYCKPYKKQMDQGDAQRMMQGMGLSPSMVQYCFGMSQMTTCNEKEKKAAEGLLQLEFVEFLEFVGRIAYIKFQGSEMEEQLNLAQKIEYVLDDLLPLVGLYRQDVFLEELSSEGEDPDY